MKKFLVTQFYLFLDFLENVFLVPKTFGCIKEIMIYIWESCNLVPKVLMD